MWTDYQAVSEIAKNPKIVYRVSPATPSFFDPTIDGVRSEELILNKQERDLIAVQADFVKADLDTMKLSLFQGGVLKEQFSILTKGKEGSWWETATGRYEILTKEVKHFSSIGHVWMPWSMQFYGNFFIHGWPSYEDGTPVQKTYSGGCIRLSTEDAAKVYSFTTRKMPVLVFDKKSVPASFSVLSIVKDEAILEITAEAALIADLDTGEVLLNKDMGKPLPVASLTKLMTGVVVSELVYLERTISIVSWMLGDVIQSYPFKAGDTYSAIDLLYPLLMESSNGAAEALSGFLGEKEFVNQMNGKAKALNMEDTKWADASGVSEENISTLKDLARLAKYILDKRKFLFDITTGKPMDAFSVSALSNITNFNEFASSSGIVGMKNGETKAAKQSILSVWKFKLPDGTERNFLVGLLRSDERTKETNLLLNWLTTSFSLRP